MANSGNCNDICSKSRQINQGQRSRKSPSSPNCLNIPSCDQSRMAVIDVLILIAVIGSCGVLLFPYVKFLTVTSVEVSQVVFCVVKEEFVNEPVIYGSIGLSVFVAALATCLVVMCTNRKCGNPNCKGLKKAAEFDIQLETEECVKNSNSMVKDGNLKKGLFELPRNHHRELEAELKKMAPPNGRAVLIFRARCGCSIGRLEVPGPKKQRKIKK